MMMISDVNNGFFLINQLLLKSFQVIYLILGVLLLSIRDIFLLASLT